MNSNGRHKHRPRLNECMTRLAAFNERKSLEIIGQVTFCCKRPSHVNNEKVSLASSQATQANTSNWTQNRPVNALFKWKKSKNRRNWSQKESPPTSTDQTVGRGSTKGGCMLIQLRADVVEQVWPALQGCHFTGHLPFPRFTVREKCTMCLTSTMEGLYI